MSYQDVVELVIRAIDAAGIAIMVIGGGWALAAFARAVLAGHGPEAYRQARVRVGRSILLGLELLIAGDIIRTVVVTPTFEAVGVLAIVVLIRAFLSIALEVELEGALPWHRRSASAAQPTEQDGK